MGDSSKPGFGAAAARFAPEEPASFCSRATPVVPCAQSVVERRDGPAASEDIADSGVVKRRRASVRDSSEEQNPDRETPIADSLSMTGFCEGSFQGDPPSGNLPSIPPRLSDHEFWHVPVGHSEPPTVLPSEPVRQQPSAARSAVARALFVVVLLSALLLLGYALSAHHDVTWDHVRAVLAGLTGTS